MEQQHRGSSLQKTKVGQEVKWGHPKLYIPQEALLYPVSSERILVYDFSCTLQLGTVDLYLIAAFEALFRT